MANLLKDTYNIDLFKQLVLDIKVLDKDFDKTNFMSIVESDHWLSLELKQRTSATTEGLNLCLSGSYRNKATILHKIAHNYNGLQGMLFPDFIGAYGKEDPGFSIAELKYLTQFSTSEFAIRHFIKMDVTGVMSILLEWTKDDNEHVRRLASEGCRPRLPWSFVLHDFIHNPSLVVKILDQLKSDPSKYVQKSVANNLNDICKDNPDILLDKLTNWGFKNKHTAWILKHASRTMLKAGEPEVLAHFGYKKPIHIVIDNLKTDKSVASIGSIFTFSCHCINTDKQSVFVRAEYIINYPRKNGDLYRKVFFIKELEINSLDSVSLAGKLDFARKSTRKIYPGIHSLDIQINGTILASHAITIK